MKSPLIPVILALAVAALGTVALAQETSPANPAEAFAARTVQAEGFKAQIANLETQLAAAEQAVAESRTALETRLEESGAPVEVYALQEAPAVVVVFRGPSGVQVRMVQLITGAGGGGGN